MHIRWRIAGYVVLACLALALWFGEHETIARWVAVALLWVMGERLSHIPGKDQQTP
jgi:hypothetical protein